MKDNIYILQWFDRAISDEVLKQKVSAEDYAFCMQLKTTTDKMSVEKPDLDANFKFVQQKMEKAKMKNIYSNTWIRYTAVAALLALFFGIYQLFFFSNKTTVAIANSKTLLLPDQSVVVINAHSEIAYPSLFLVNRKLQLKGEAYFEVEKGSVFKVISPRGNVQVLGTKFNVKSYPDWFEVTCYEGSVDVHINKQKFTLKPGNSIRNSDMGVEKMEVFDKNPQWIKGVSTFKSVPLSVVFQSFNNNYGGNVVLPKTYENLKFTGGFVHNDINKALESICTPVGLQYEITGNKIILTKKR